MPEFAAPGVGRESTDVSIELEMNDGASGVLYAVGGAGGGLTVYLDEGHLIYEYNMMIIKRYTALSKKPLSAGKHTIDIATRIAGPGKAGTATLSINGEQVAVAELARTVPAAFTATETFDVGVDLGSPVSIEYAERRPFPFTGKIERVDVTLR